MEETLTTLGIGEALAQVLKSPVARTVAGAEARGLMGAIFGAPRRRRY